MIDRIFHLLFINKGDITLLLIQILYSGQSPLFKEVFWPFSFFLFRERTKNLRVKEDDHVNVNDLDDSDHAKDQ